MQYAEYPFKAMGISQGPSGSYSHTKYSQGSPKDYPIDEAGANTGKDYMYAPCDVVVMKIYGVGSKSQPNTVWLQSIEHVVTPIGIFYICGRVTHMSDADLKGLKVGHVFKKGEKMFREGVDGGATGNHIHMTWGTGKYKAPGWKQNNRGAYVLTTTGTNHRVENIFFLNRAFTTKVRATQGISFKETPKKKNMIVSVGKSKLNVRASYGEKSKIVGKLKTGAAVTVYCTRNKRACVGYNKWVHTDYLKNIK